MALRERIELPANRFGIGRSTTDLTEQMWTRGLEPPTLAGLAPQASAYTKFRHVHVKGDAPGGDRTHMAIEGPQGF